MKTVCFNVKGPARKELVEAIEQIAGMKAVYKKAPTFEYAVSNFIIDKNGSVSCKDEDSLERLVHNLIADGFRPQEEEKMSEKSGMAIQMPAMTGDELSRLEQLIASKETLLKKAVGADSLMVGEKDGKLDFAWFKADASPDEVKAYMHLVATLCRTAKEAKRITGKDRPVENEKYAFRCFLLRLGFIGDEFKTSRKVLLQNFSGSSAFKGGASDEISR